MSSISVIVPVYKVEPFLHRCVDSILAQTFEDFELILVDDGSPDNCGTICDEYAEKDSRIHVIHQKNGGLSAARNTGIDWVFANSDSRWLSFVDSDDWLCRDFLKTLYSIANDTLTLCKISACGFYYTAGEMIPSQQDYSVECLSADDYYCESYHERATSTACNKLYHKSLFKELRFPIGKLHEDEFTVYQAIYKVGKIGVTPAQLYAYYQNPDGIMRSEWNPRRMHVLEAFEQQIAFAQKNGNDRLLKKIVMQYIYSTYEHLSKTIKVYRKELRRKLRTALKLGRECGCFPLIGKHLWAYEAAYPFKPFWWLVFKLQLDKK